jgi:acylphosphatase
VITRRYVVSGRVQGVGFRWFVLQQARRLDLSGYARNCADGTVEVVARGDEAALMALEQLLVEGPELAAVSEVHTFDDTGDDHFTSFDIRRT